MLFFLQANTRFAFSSAIPIVAIEPELNFKKSVSIPSEKISPLFGIKDCIISFDSLVIIPAVVSTWVRLLAKGSLTANINWLSLSFILFVMESVCVRER